MKDKTTDQAVNTIVLGDCIAGLKGLAEGSVDLVFADPPFNIGYDYDVYRDELESNEYLTWSREWISAVYRALKPTGTFWLAIGDEYAAELKIESQRIGFFPRSWVIWYYTFGVNCKYKFTRSHAHLLYFVKDRQKFTFNADDLDNRVPSARQLVYNDKRGNPDGRLPDDTWIIRPADAIGELVADDAVWTSTELRPPNEDDHTWTLRPQDLERCFRPSEHTWYFPRVAGTFKERAGFHGCQMPEQLLGRIIRLCSEPNDLVVDPFSGSATTLAVAKKLARRYVGFDISPEYVKLGHQRLESVCVGDRLDGAPEPTMSAPATKLALGKKSQRGRKKPHRPTDDESRTGDIETRFDRAQLKATLLGVVEAFRLSHDGFSADYVVASKERNHEFTTACRRLGLIGDARTWNTLLLRQRKNGKLTVATTRRKEITWADCDSYLFASEIALQQMLDEQHAESLDEILCDPEVASEFDRRANRLVPGLGSFECRWAALKLRKAARLARHRGAVLAAPRRLRRPTPIEDFDLETTQEKPGVYIVAAIDEKLQRLYIGGTLNLRGRLRRHLDPMQKRAWTELSESLGVQGKVLGVQEFVVDARPGELLAWQSCLARKYKPRLNYHELWQAS